MRVKPFSNSIWNANGTKRVTILFREDCPEDVDLLKRVISFCQKKYSTSMDAGVRELVKVGLGKNGY